MKPLNLKMQAFGPYAGLCEIDFAAIDHGLYLLTGPTGAGKTTIFDAIKYALYGRMSGADREAKSARSDFADPDVRTYVELEFEHAGKVYRAMRAPAQRRRKKKKGADGWTERPAEASLECVSDSRSLAGRSGDMNRCIEELLGIDADQFGRIVMIAQGEFSQILNAGTDKRREIFRRVFSTDGYLALQQSLKELDRQLDRELDSKVGLIEDQIAQIRVPGEGKLSDAFRELSSQGDGAFRAGEYLDLLGRLQDECSGRLQSGEEELSQVKRETEELQVRVGAARSLDAARVSLRESRAWLRDNESAVEQARQKLRELEAGRGDIDALALSADVLERSLTDYDALAAREGAAAGARRDLDAALEAQRAAETELAALAERRSHAEKEREGLADLDVRAQKLRHDREALAERRARLSRLEGLLDRASADASRADSDAAASVRANGAYEEAATAHTGARCAYNAQIAGVLAHDLQPGRPCPVCGSTEHPHLAVLPEGAVSKEDVDALEAEELRLREKASRWARRASASRADAAASQKAASQSASELLGCGDLEAARPALDLRLAEAGTLEKELEAAWESIQASRERLGVLRRLLDGLSEQDAAWEEKLANARNERDEARERLSRYEAAAAAIRERLEFSSADEAACELQARRAELAERRGALEKARAESERLDREQDVMRARAAEAERMLEGSRPEDLPSLEARLEDAKGRSAAFERGIAVLSGRLEDYRRIAGRIASLMHDMEGIEKRRNTAHGLSAVANGEKAGAMGRLTFETYVQGVYFDQVLAAANERLQAMSDMRYSLRRRRESKDGRTASGLDMDVLDRNTGRLRGVDTLSGGETFLASLSLALGFSDAIQAQAGGISIDAMFIDEGFGSLDEDTCRNAVAVLERLAADNRLIGVISHVDLLKSHIDRRISVTKGPAGSTAVLEL